jgi:4-hydroxy-tetrahydrodipicolinate reductase
VIDLVIAGIRGRMGQALLQLAEAKAPAAAGVRIIGGIARNSGRMQRAGAGSGELPVVTAEGAGDLIAQAAVVIDFTGASGTHALLEQHADTLSGRALVIGSTGLQAETLTLLDGVSGRTAVLMAANFSVGVNLLLALVARASATLPAAEYDIEIVEAHHGRKVDAPSGTALALADAAARGRGVALQDVRRDGRSGESARPVGEIGLHAVRGGNVIGEHQVLFLGARERVELNHAAQDRALFAEGALRAACWLAGRPAGRYAMKDVLGLGS